MRKGGQRQRRRLPKASLWRWERDLSVSTSEDERVECEPELPPGTIIATGEGEPPKPTEAVEPPVPNGAVKEEKGSETEVKAEVSFKNPPYPVDGLPGASSEPAIASEAVSKPLEGEHCHPAEGSVWL